MTMRANVVGGTGGVIADGELIVLLGRISCQKITLSTYVPFTEDAFVFKLVFS